MPAYADEVAQAKEEGVNFQFLTQPIKILGEDHVNGIVCQGIELGKADASGRRRPIPLHGSETALWVDEVITAIGQIAPQTKISLGDEPLRLTERRNIWSNPVNLATNLPGLAGGDIVTGRPPSWRQSGPENKRPDRFVGIAGGTPGREIPDPHTTPANRDGGNTG